MSGSAQKTRSPDSLSGPARPSTDSGGSRQSLHLLLTLGGLLVVAAALLVPSIAFAIPGSGEFVALKSGSGREITELYNFIAKICLGILIIVEGALLFAIFKFRRTDDGERPVQNHGDLRLEFGWTMAALIIQIVIGVATIDVMFSTETEPDAGFDMAVTAKAEMWDWSFEYDPADEPVPGDQRLIHEDLVVPAHTNVKLRVTSEDVIHAIFIPDLGVKIDAVPGRFNHWWFRADGPIGQVRAENFATIDRPDFEYPQTRDGVVREGRDATARRVTGLEQHVSYLGTREDGEDEYLAQIDYQESPYRDYNAIEYQGTCAELCGAGHWDMYFRAVVMTRSSFQRWYRTELADVEEADGAAVFAAECADAGCHGQDGSPDQADVQDLVDNPLMVDEDQKEDHIEAVLQGPGRMPSFHGSLNDDEVAAVVNHERTSWGNDGGTVDEEMVAEIREALGHDPFPAAVVEPEDVDDLMTSGERLYRSCASCHGDDGESIDEELVPALAGNDLVVDEDPSELARILIEGRDTDEYPGRKRPVARSMDDLQLAALLTYIRQSFGNDAAPVQPYDIRDVRRDTN